MNAQTFDTAELIAIMRFRNYFKLAYDTHGVNRGAAMGLFHLSMKKTASAVLNAYTCLKTKKNYRPAEGTLATSCKAVKYLLSIYTTEDSIAKTDERIATSNQSSNMDDNLQCGSVYDNTMLYSRFIAVLYELIRHKIHAD